MTWILALATVMVLAVIAVAYRRASRERCRAAHPSAGPAVRPLLAAVNGDVAAAPARAGRHLRLVGPER